MWSYNNSKNKTKYYFHTKEDLVNDLYACIRFEIVWNTVPTYYIYNDDVLIETIEPNTFIQAWENMGLINKGDDK